MTFFVQQTELRDIYDKVAAGERISEADAVRLFESKNLNAVGAIADFARQRKVGNQASYIVNRYINYSNYCILSCQFCSIAMLTARFSAVKVRPSLGLALVIMIRLLRR